MNATTNQNHRSRHNQQQGVRHHSEFIPHRETEFVEKTRHGQQHRISRPEKETQASLSRLAGPDEHVAPFPRGQDAEDAHQPVIAGFTVPDQGAGQQAQQDKGAEQTLEQHAHFASGRGIFPGWCGHTRAKCTENASDLNTELAQRRGFFRKAAARRGRRRRKTQFFPPYIFPHVRKSPIFPILKGFRECRQK